VSKSSSSSSSSSSSARSRRSASSESFPQLQPLVPQTEYAARYDAIDRELTTVLHALRPSIPHLQLSVE
jgi:hypothetical protein